MFPCNFQGDIKMPMKLVISVDKKGLTTLQDVLINTRLNFIWIWSVRAGNFELF